MQERINGSMFDMLVQWQVGDMVGIGIETPDGKHIVDALYGEDESMEKIGHLFAEMLKKDRNIDAHEGYRNANALATIDMELGRMILDAVTGSEPYNGIWTWFDRGSCNRLVRLVRKARDFVFGRDE